MGQIASGFQLESERSKLSSNLTPDRSDWITAHAVVTKLAIVETERLWGRFQQLGCDSRGELTTAAIQNNSIAEDIFAKNILATLKSANGNVTFLTFLNCMKWAEGATQEDKTIAIFNLINNGEPITRDLLMKLVKRLYPGEDQKRYDQLTDVTMTQIGGRRNGTMKEKPFLDRTKSLPQTSVGPYFSYYIIPPELNEEARQAFTSLSKHPPLQQSTSRNPADWEYGSNTGRNSAPARIPTDNILQRISSKIHKRDWHMLANRLGFTADDISKFEGSSPENTEDQVFAMLKGWRSKEGSLATCNALEDTLQQCNMADAGTLLYP